jgi:hypothetical protein
MRARALYAMVAALVLALTWAPSASADPGTAAEALDPYAELANSEDQLVGLEAEAERLAEDQQTAQEALSEARAALEATVGERETAEAELDRAEQAITTARGAVEEATTRLNATIGQLQRLRQLRDRLDDVMVTAAEADTDDGAALLLTEVTVDAVLRNDDPEDDTETVDVLSRLAKRPDDGVTRVTSLDQEFARTQGEQARLVLDHRDDHRQAIERRDVQLAAIADLERLQAEQEATVQAAEDTVGLFEAMLDYNDLSRADIQYQIESWSAYIDSLQAVPRRSSVPYELVHYGNGRIPAEALVPIGVGHHRLWGPAARAFKALQAAAGGDGIAIGVTDSYRSYEAQVDVARRKGLYVEGGLAARPGTSPHGWGLALDLDLDAEAQRWMRQNAHRYGFVENTPREPWHWVFTAQPRS